ncbi:MAG: biopolymer transporter ExbD [Chthoniobacteraceae bacterium]
MKIHSPIEEKKARIEIVPLIDIMFFLLACFMIVSLKMIQMRGVKVNLPTATHAEPVQKSDFISVTVTQSTDAAGAAPTNIYLEKDQVSLDQLYERVKAQVLANPDARVYIRADKDSLHGEVMDVLDKIKDAGVSKVAFEIKSVSVTTPTTSASSTAPAAPAPTAPPAPPAAPAQP